MPLFAPFDCAQGCGCDFADAEPGLTKIFSRSELELILFLFHVTLRGKERAT